MRARAAGRRSRRAPASGGPGASLRVLTVTLVVLAALVALPAAAGAHPLGNFTINRLAVVSASQEHVDVHWVLDQAEIPTFRERAVAPRAVLARKRAAALRGLTLTVDGRRVPLRAVGPGRISFPAGQGGLATTRVELDLRAAVRAPRAVVLADATFADRLGWRSIVVRPATGTAVRADAPAEDVTGGLRAYPRALLEEPSRVDRVALRVAPGAGTVVAPRARGAGLETTGARGGDAGFAALFADAAAGRGVLVLLLLAACGWGALHALSPGHGKAMVAAALVGTRGTSRDALALGATVTVAHTTGVFALGLVALALSQFILPEDLYPWLTLVSGLLVVGVGASVLRARLRARRAAQHHHHHHHHAHDHPHGDRLTPRAIVALGASAGLLPCPSALVVLLAAVAQHELVLGLALIVAFSLGLAATLTITGLLVVRTSGLLRRHAGSGRIMALLPAASAIVIIGVGVVLSVRAIPQIGG